MKYFLISCDKENNNIPILKNWYGEIEHKNINVRNHYFIDDRKLFIIEKYKSLVFTDVISNPFFLISEMFKKVLDMYKIKMTYKQIVLLEKEYKYVNLYYLPILREVECISDKTEFIKYTNNVKKLILHRNKIGKRDILFKVVIHNKDYVVVRMDLIESILRRGAKGIKLEKIEME